MLKHPHEVRIASAGELEEALEGVLADGEPRILLRDGKRIAVIVSPDDYKAPPDDDIWANYDPERVRRAFDDATGILDGLDIEEFKRELRAARGQDSRGRPGD